MRPVLFAIALGLAACASGPSSAPSNATAAQSGSGAQPKQICREEATTGSNITHIVCRTPEQADDERAAARTWRAQPTGVPTAK